MKKQVPSAEVIKPKLVRAEVILSILVFGGFKMPGDIVEVDEITFRNLEKKGRLKLAEDESNKKIDPPIPQINPDQTPPIEPPMLPPKPEKNLRKSGPRESAEKKK